MENYKKLYRSKENRVLFGVCGGLAEYFDMDPVIMRLIFVVLALISGIGIILYIIAIIVIPEAPETNESQKKHKDSSDIKNNTQDKVHQKVEAIASEIKENFKTNPRSYKGEQIFGLIILLIGLSTLFNNFFPGFDIGKLWPLLLIIIGLAFLLNTGKKG